MNKPTLLFVHGTGVRGVKYSATFDVIKEKVRANNLPVNLRGCFWGESQGARMGVQGTSIPEYVQAGGGKEPTSAEQQLALWSVLYTDPWYELRLLRNFSNTAPVPLGQQPPAELLRRSVKDFVVPEVLAELLAAAHLQTHFAEALRQLYRAPEFTQATETAPAQPLLHRQAISRALMAWTLVASSEEGNPAVSGDVRDAIVEAVTAKLHGHGMGITDFLTRPLKGMALKYVTHRLTSDRGQLTDRLTDPGGDIMRYLARGNNAREFLKQSIADCGNSPVILLGHSLGGIMCADLLIGQRFAQVILLVTVGSQAPFLYEVGALPSLEPPATLPAYFPPWLNIYDRRDLLSYIGAEVFPQRVIDYAVDNGQPFPDSHSAYWSNSEVWTALAGALA